MKSTSRLSETPWYEYCIIIIFIAIAAYVGIDLCVFTGYSKFFDKDYIDGYGSLIGGLAGAIGIYYLYNTLKSQNESQQLSSFENRYIQMITFHRDMTKELRIENTTEFVSAKTDGSAACSMVLTMVDQARSIVASFIKDKEVKKLYKNDNEYNADCSLWGKDNLQLRTEINIAYLITFIGVSSINLPLLKSILEKRYSDDFSNSVIDRFLLILKGEHNDIVKNDPVARAEDVVKDEKKYAGVQDVLGNYFRLLYNTVGYLHEQKWIDKEDRYTYAKMLRCQLTDNEEVLLFYNSLSDFGIDWEYNGDKGKSLITEYQLIKNISMHVDEAKRFYPNIAFEKL